MYTLHPDDNLCLSDRSKLAARALMNLRAAFRRSGAAAIDDDLLARFALDPLVLIHPEFFHWHANFATAAASGDRYLVDGALSRLREVATLMDRSRERAAATAVKLGARMDLESNTEMSRTTLSLAIRQESRTLRDREPKLVDRLTAAEEADVRAAFGLLSRYCHSMFDEIQANVQCLHFFDVPGLIGFSSGQAHGAIFLRREDFGDPIAIAEQVLHEASHVRLNCALVTTQMFDETDERVETPLRRDRRPFVGAFHQVYVLGRMFYFYSQLVPDTGRGAARCLLRAKQLEEALDAVDRHPALRPIGQKLVESVREFYDSAEGKRTREQASRSEGV